MTTTTDFRIDQLDTLDWELKNANTGYATHSDILIFLRVLQDIRYFDIVLRPYYHYQYSVISNM